MNWDPGLRSDGREARGEWWISESTAVKIMELPRGTHVCASILTSAANHLHIVKHPWVFFSLWSRWTLRNGCVSSSDHGGREIS